MTLRYVLPTALALTPGLALADGHDADVQALFEALQMPQIIEVMREEGRDYGDQIADELFPGPPPAEWPVMIEAIYDGPTMAGEILTSMGTALAQSEVQEILAFIDTDLGARVISLEVEARRARLNPDIEEAANEHAMLSAMDETPRFLQVQDYIEANDLIETNVVAALNFNFAFMQGLAEGGALPGDMTDDMILSQIWGQEREVRGNTTEWMYSFLLMAYQPLEDDELAAYIDFAKSDAGQALNRAIISAFDPLYTDISKQVGRAAAEVMTVQEL